MRRNITGATLSVAACAAAAACLAGTGCSAFKAEESKGQIVFSHTLHAEQADCTDCHTEVAGDSGGPAGKHIPASHAACGNCHDVASGCETCHRGAREGVKMARKARGLAFSHKAHADRVKGCKSCHPADRQGGAVIPGHATCNTQACHAREHATLQCGGCHRDLRRYAARPDGTLTHGPGFAKAHGVLARQNVRGCVQCHDQTYCADCHSPTSLARASVRFPEKVTAGFIHRGDFVSRHGIEARSDPQSCRKCHGQRYCRSCHALAGLATAPHEDLSGGRAVQSAHPAGWMIPGSSDFHGHRARLDIGACASCHDRGGASNCVSCHRVGGTGGNPHPAGWSWRDKENQCRAAAMCRTCHVNGAGCR